MFLMQFAQMRFVDGQFVWVWPGEAQRATCGGSLVICWMFKSAADLAQTWRRNVRFNFTEGPTYVYSLSVIFAGYLQWPRGSWNRKVKELVKESKRQEDEKFGIKPSDV